MRDRGSALYRTDPPLEDFKMMDSRHTKTTAEGESLQAPDVVTRALSGEEFMALFTTFKKSAFRLETLPQTLVDRHDAAFEAFLNGTPLPLNQNEKWCQLIRESADEGKTFSRVHILPEKLTPYLRYEIEWGYVFNVAAGSDIRLLEYPNVTEEIRQAAKQDYWLFDNETVVLMDYTQEDGRYLGARIIEPGSNIEKYNYLKDITWARATEFKEFLSKYRKGEIP